IHSRLLSQNLRESALDLPSHSWQGCTDLARQIRRAQMRGWHSAANALSCDLAHTLQSVQRELTGLEQRLIPARRPPTMSSGELYKDLIALQEEFEVLDFEIGNSRLSVTTEAIVLDGVYLGPFEIQL